MKQLIMIFAVLGLTYGAQAVEVGDAAPCVIIDQLLPDGSENQECIREVLDDSHSYTFLEFFSINCGACMDNLPILSGIGLDLAADVTLRYVSIDRNEQAVRDFVGGNADIQAFPVSLDSERMATRAYSIFATPTLVVLDRDNTVVYRHTGVLGEEDINDLYELVQN